MRKGNSKTGTDLFLSYDNGNSWVTAPHIIPYTTDDHVGYSNSFTFSADGKIIYAINNPQNPDNPEKSKMVFASAGVEEITDSSPAGVILPITAIIAITGGITVFIIKRKLKNKHT